MVKRAGCITIPEVHLIQTMMMMMLRNWWLLALCGVLDGIFSVVCLIMQDSDGLGIPGEGERDSVMMPNANPG